ncbi:MAG: hypothetical protein Q7U38_10960 [Methylobacter sp.]|nr:hypothetical protein [Methylobacter sp.]MDP2099732.1 hypothetical protein [Methylobacter sp.]MDP2430366.1 hypothetical protein [Methylobacter sp.]MDP3053534.1 hypothetical protein [Methylobacter sp.]MDP3362713.1 hypothetical protein [Methylobacter sp.]
MKTTHIFSPVLFIAAVLFNGTTSAYDVGKVDEMCKKPQFRDFSLPVYQEPEKTEVPPESTLSFMVSPWADPETILLTAKNKKLDYTIESNSSFHRIKAKLPAEFNGNFVRINVKATALLGCSDKTGWLVKVAEQ